MLKNMKEFINSITFNKENQLYFNKPILFYVDAKEFVISTTKLPNSLKWDLFNALERRYDILSKAPDLSKEITFLEAVYRYVTEYIEANNGKNSSVQLEGAFKKHLISAITHVRRFIADSTGTNYQ